MPLRAEAWRVPAPAAVAALVAASAVARTLLGWLRELPAYFPDEYLYAELARSLAQTGKPLVRGAEASFHALLQPLVTAALWLPNDPELAFRATQALNATLMSLAAIPVYLLGRELGLHRWLSVGLSALTLTLPDLLYTGWIVAEPLATPLALGAILAGVRALSRPSPQRQLSFLVLAGLAAFARLQLAVLAIAYLAAALALGARRRRLAAFVREQAVVLATLAAGAIGGLAIGPGRILGIYRGVLHPSVDGLALAEATGRNLFVLAYAGGVVLVPGALIGLVLALARPRRIAERAFGALTVALTAILLLQAGLYGDREIAQERYLFLILPLLAVAFGLYAARGWPLRRLHALLALALLTLTAAVPLSGYAAAAGKTHSPFLFAVFRLEGLVGEASLGALVVAVCAAAGLGAVLLASARPRVATPAALGCALAFSAAAYAGAVGLDLASTRTIRASYLPERLDWIDATVREPAVYLATPGGSRTATLEQLFWNSEIAAVAVLPGAISPDPFAASPARVTADGLLLIAGQPVREPIVLDVFAATVELRDAEVVARGPTHVLWQPRGAARLSFALLGRYPDGFLAGGGTVVLWPPPGEPLAGRLELLLDAPAQAGEVLLELLLPSGRERPLRITSTPVRISVRVCSAGRWLAHFRADRIAVHEGRFVSARASELRFVPDATACPSLGGRT